MSFDLIYAILLLSSLATPMVLSLVLFFIWKARGRDPKGKSIIIPQYETYQHIPPAVMGVVLRERVEVQDLVATLIDLAERGYLSVESVRAAPGQVFKEENVTTNFAYVLKQLKPADANLKAFEQTLFHSIFTSGPTKYILNFLESELIKIKPQLDKEIYTETIALGLIRHSPEEIRQKYIRYSKIFKVAGYILFITGIGIGLLADAYILRWFGRVMPARTHKGVEALEWSRGLEMYIKFAERYRLNRPTGEIQKLLPEAMVLKAVKEWSAHVKSETTQLPIWYHTPVASADAIVRFVNFLNTL